MVEIPEHVLPDGTQPATVYKKLSDSSHKKQQNIGSSDGIKLMQEDIPTSTLIIIWQRKVILHGRGYQDSHACSSFNGNLRNQVQVATLVVYPKSTVKVQ